MHEPPAPRSSRRRPYLLPALLSAAVVLLAAATVVIVWIWPGESEASGPAEIVSRVGHDVCADQITIDLSSDDEMRRLAEEVHADPRTRRIYLETQDEAYRRFMVIFKDNPKLLSAVRRDAVSASVLLIGRDDVDLHAWADDLKRSHPEASRVTTFVRAEAVQADKAKYGTSDIPSCPAGGEF